MKTNYVRVIVWCASSLLVVALGRADETAHSQIIKERDAGLSRILSHRESQLKTGTGDPEAVTAAKVALWVFRRDTASTSQEKIRQQELIVGERERNVAAVKERMNAGLGDQISLLVATDCCLEAKQVLEELRMAEKKK